MKTPEWMPFFGFDFFNSPKVQAMSNEEIGAYLRLIWFQWQEGVIPDDPDEIRGICHMDDSSMARAWPRLTKCFTKSPGGLANPRIKMEADKAGARLHLAATKGSKGGLAKSLKWHGIPSTSLAPAKPVDASLPLPLPLPCINPDKSAPQTVLAPAAPGAGEKKKTKAGEDVPIPAELNAPLFTVAWGKWLRHRRESRKPFTATAAEQSLARLAPMGIAAATAAVLKAVEAGWQGIHPESSAAHTSRYAAPHGAAKTDINSKTAADFLKE